jgi:hypothetical protein
VAPRKKKDNGYGQLTQYRDSEGSDRLATIMQNSVDQTPMPWVTSNRSLEELELEARNLYLAGRFQDMKRPVAVAMLFKAYPQIGVHRLNEMTMEWQAKRETMAKRADVRWAREELLYHIECSQLRASYAATVLRAAVASEGKMPVSAEDAIATAMNSVGTIEALAAWRAEETYQGTLIQKIANLKDTADEADEEADVGGKMPHWVETMAKTVEELRPDGTRLKRMENMRRATYGNRNIEFGGE